MYDSGKDVVLDDQFNPNDSACILKEYLRSLPDTLLTGDLYSSFLIASSKCFVCVLILSKKTKNIFTFYPRAFLRVIPVKASL